MSSEKELEDLANGFDRHLHKVLKDGREVMNRDGELTRVEATAADLNVIRQRLKDCGITSVGTQGSPIGNIVEEMRKRELKLPPLDTDDDVATA